MNGLLITGHSGFVGTSLLAAWPSLAGGADLEPMLVPTDFDVRESSHWDTQLARKPRAILHLAAQSHVPTAFARPHETLEINLLGTLAMLEAACRNGFAGRILYVSSADVYGLVPPESLPISEDYAAAPRNPYAVSKMAAEALCRQYVWTHGLDIVMARPFNHSGPGQSADFALSGFARSVAAIALGLVEPVIAVGDIDVTRDFLHVHDVLEAYFLLLQYGVPGEVYNICSGQETLLRGALQHLQDIAGTQAAIHVDTARLRRAEQRRVCGSPTKLESCNGSWRPRRPLPLLLEELLEFWKRELRK